MTIPVANEDTWCSSKFFVVGLLLSFSFGLQGATTYRVQTGKISFTAIGKPGFLRIHGEKAQPEGNFALEDKNKVLQGEVRVNLRNLETGIAQRDQHMRDKYLEVSKYPEAVFQMSPNTVLTPGDTVILPGILTLHGVSRALSVPVSVRERGEPLEVNGQFTVQLSDYGIGIPSFAGVTVAKEVQILVQFMAGRQP